jgi:hypothetical protein
MHPILFGDELFVVEFEVENHQIEGVLLDIGITALQTLTEGTHHQRCEVREP